jgi:hypothetical protein
MLILGTGDPKASARDDKIVISVPSGDDRMEIALTLNQTLVLIADARRAVSDAMTDGFAAPPADVVKFARRCRKARN